MSKWNEAELLAAIEYIKDNKSYKEIGVKLNRSAKAIKEKLNSLSVKLTDYTIKNINYCLNCGGKIENHGVKFCSRSCAASFNNKLRPKKVVEKSNKDNLKLRKRKEYNLRKRKKCLNCGVLTTNKFCSSNCQHEFHQKEIFESIENGNTLLHFRQYKKYLIHKYGEKCMECGWAERNEFSGSVPIELEHIDGNSSNNLLSNLKLLCPNCHSLTSTYKRLNAGNGRHARKKRYSEGKSY